MFNINLSKGAALELLNLVDAQLVRAELDVWSTKEGDNPFDELYAKDRLAHLLELKRALAEVEEDYESFCQE